MSGPGSHWQVRLLVVRFMRQDRLWGVEGGSVHRVGRVRALGRTTQKAPTETNYFCFPALGHSLWGHFVYSPVSLQPLGKLRYRHVQGQMSQSSNTLSSTPVDSDSVVSGFSFWFCHSLAV